jgi:hypothetical protein
MEMPTRVLLVPYLHERRIYLNKLKPSTDYFYTTIQTPYASEASYYKAVKFALDNHQPPSSVNIIEAMKP